MHALARHSGLTRWQLAEALALLLIVSSGAALRLHTLATNPAWYTDEATHVDMATNLLNGELRYMAVEGSWLLFARLPLFEVSAAGAFALLGSGLAALRLLTACCGVLTIALLYGGLRHLTRDPLLALLVAGLYALLPQAVLYSRFGFSYNLLLPLMALMLWAGALALRDRSRTALIGYSVCVGLGCLSDVLVWTFVPVSLLWLWRVGWRETLLALGLMLAPLALYLGAWWLVAPDALAFDLGYTLGRTGGGTLAQQSATLRTNLTVLLSNGWWVAGVIGLFAVRDPALRVVGLSVLLPLLIVGRGVALYSLSAYYTIAFLPLLALGVAALVRLALDLCTRFGWRYGGVGIALLLSVWLGPQVWQLQHAVRNGFVTEIEPFLIAPHEAQAVADWLNPRLQADSSVIASAGVAWLLQGQVADFQMAVAAAGVDAIHIPADLPRARYAFDPRFEVADMVVIDNLWRNWGVVHMPYLAQQVAQVEREWTLVYETAQIAVYSVQDRP